MKRLFVDIETSPNICFTWRTGRKITLQPESILQERAIICICYKFEEQKTINALKWDNGDDTELLKEFAIVAEKADEIVGHNLDRFDIPWISTRNLIHNLPPLPQYKTIDTLKTARKHFYLNSNRLDYLGQILLGEGKIKTDYDLWKRVVLDGDNRALSEMVRYCKKDVDLLQRVYDRLSEYDSAASHAGVLSGLPRWTCPHCASENVRVSKTKTTPKGMIQKQMQCKDCHRYYTIAHSVWKKYILDKTGDLDLS